MLFVLQVPTSGTCVCRVPKGFLPVMVGSTRSEKLKVDEQERVVQEDMVRKILDPPLLLFCQGLFKKIAEATGESLESVCQMQEAERNGLVEALMLEQVHEHCSLSSSC